MNDNAVKLFEEAMEFAYATIGKEHADTSYFQGTIAGKLTELIIKECTNQCNVVAELAKITNTGEMARKTSVTAESCAMMIKQHFGVE